MLARSPAKTRDLLRFLLDPFVARDAAVKEFALDRMGGSRSASRSVSC